MLHRGPNVLPQQRPSGASPSCSTAPLQRSQRRASEARRQFCVLQATATQQKVVTKEEAMANEYNQTMQQQMQWDNPYEYRVERGLYYHEVSPGLICGTQPRSAADISTLASRGITHIVNLQQDKDMQHWGVNFHELQHRAGEVGIKLLRRQARDFDPHSLRKALPSAVAAVRHALADGGRVYVHCTAGLGRAPAVCIAYMYWFVGMELDIAYKTLTDIRPCGPKRDAIRGATHDLLSHSTPDHFQNLDKNAWATLADEDRFALQWRVLKGQ